MTVDSYRLGHDLIISGYIALWYALCIVCLYRGITRRRR